MAFMILAPGGSTRLYSLPTYLTRPPCVCFLALPKTAPLSLPIQPRHEHDLVTAVVDVLLIDKNSIYP